MMIVRLPIPVLRPFVSLVWASDGAPPGPYPRPVREHLLPGGTMHLVFRLTDDPLHVSAPDDPEPQRVGGAVVGGARSRFYVRELSAPSCSVGAMLRPGASQLLFGPPADELAERHTPIEDLWGVSARTVRTRMQDATSGEERLAILETTLAARLPRVHGLHPAVFAVLEAMPALSSVADAAKRGGVSHRHFIAQFRRAVGLPPKTYMRILRFQHALQLIRQDGAPSLAAVAADAHYSDQSHLCREFMELAGTTPLAFARRSPGDANHLPVESDRPPRGQFSSRLPKHGSRN